MPNEALIVVFDRQYFNISLCAYAKFIDFCWRVALPNGMQLKFMAFYEYLSINYLHTHTLAHTPPQSERFLSIFEHINQFSIGIFFDRFMSINIVAVLYSIYFSLKMREFPSPFCRFSLQHRCNKVMNFQLLFVECCQSIIKNRLK